MTTQQRVEQARKALYRLENDCRLLPAEIDAIRIDVLGMVTRPQTLGQAHRLIDALEARLHRVTSEVPF